MSLVAVPFYIRFLGIEAYALIGFFVLLQALLSFLDLGLSTTLNRQLARISAANGSNEDARDLVRTLELIYWPMGLLIALALVLAAPLLARQWVNAQDVPVDVVEQAIRLMGVVAALQWPASLYAGGLMGVQRQVLLNAVRVTAATLQTAGAVLILLVVSPTIQAYFMWQALVIGGQTIAIAYCLWSSLPHSGHRPRFRRTLWHSNWQFAAGMTGISLLATVLTQSDKIILTKLLPLHMFGYYALAATVATGFSYLASPVFSALFPKFSQLVAQGNLTELTAHYHKSAQLVSVIVVPAWVMAAFFSQELLSAWVNDPTTVDNTYYVLSLLATGSALNSLMLLPLALQLAYGWTSLSFYKNVVAVIAFVPLLIWMIGQYGAAGAATTWIILNAGYVLVEIPIMHHRLLRGEMWAWYFVDVGLPVAIGSSVGLLARALLPMHAPLLLALGWMLLASMLILLGSFYALRLTGRRLREYEAK